jgi:uncharacterized protein YjiK
MNVKKIVLSIFLLIVLLEVLMILLARDVLTDEIIISNKIDIKGDSITEPSGAVFNPYKKTLYVVSDEGYIFELNKKGKVLREKKLGRLDLEGVTYDSINKRIFAVVEKEDLIIEIDEESFEIKKTFKVNRFYNNKEVLNPERDGFEGIAIIPEEQVFYLVNQGFSLKEKYANDAPAIIKVEIPSDENYESTDELQIEEYYRLDVDDLAEIVYTPNDNSLLVLSDSNDLLMKYSLLGERLSEAILEENGKEGLTFDDEDWFYLFQEDGSIKKFNLTK